MTRLYIGLMSGTSLDGVDGVLVDFSVPDPAMGQSLVQVVAHAHRPFAPALAEELLALNTPGPNELHRAALASSALTRLCGEVVQDVLNASGVASTQVAAIGAHGQTVRHRPGEFDGTGYTLQLNNPALLAELCGIDVVADFRNRDVAAGGQGAPLVPAFHRAVFGRAGKSVAVLNIGGFANLTALRADGTVCGFDCGPGNALLDHWCHLHSGRPYDAAGAWAATGRVDETLLARLLADPYFSLPPPKSTGRDQFHPGWLAKCFSPGSALAASDVQATLAELTASACATEVTRHATDASELLVCGGGALNDHLMARLAARLPGMTVHRTDDRGLPSQQVEACAFAWLARAFVQREPGNLPAVTGAHGARILGALYPS